VPRKRQRREERPVDVTLPITPMLDMSFQLLSFFILTFHPMPTEGQLSLNLPKIDASEKAEKDPTEITDEKKDEYTITVISNSSGEVALLALKGPTGDMGNIKNMPELLDRLQKLPKPQGKAELISIMIEASNDLTYAKLIEVMDLCKKAGYDTVNLMPTKGG
jgi:biopolymer transport protein ExbD